MNDNKFYGISFYIGNNGSGATTCIEFDLPGGGGIYYNQFFGGRVEFTNYVIAGKGVKRFTTTGTTNGTTVLVVADVTNLRLGTTLSSSSGDIPANTYVKAISGLNVTMSASATGSNAGQTITFLDFLPLVTGNTLTFSDLVSWTKIGPNTLVYGDTAQDTTMLTLNTVTTPGMDGGGLIGDRLVKIGQDNIAVSGGSIFPPSRGALHKQNGTYVASIAGKLLMDEVVFTDSSTGIVALIDLTQCISDVHRKILFELQQGALAGGMIMVSAYAADGVTVRDSFGDVAIIVGEQYAGPARFASTVPFNTNSTFNATGANIATIAFGPNVAYAAIGINPFFAVKSFKSFTLTSIKGSRIRLLGRSEPVQALASVSALVNSDAPRSTAVPDAPTVVAISAITQANPGQVTTAAVHGLATGNLVSFSGLVGMTQLNGKSCHVTVIDTTNFTIGIDTSGYSAFTSGNVTTNTYPVGQVVNHMAPATGSPAYWVFGAAGAWIAGPNL